MKIQCREFQLKLRDPFTIARGTTTVQPTLIVQVEYEGLVGYGEATANDYYGVSLATMTAALDSVATKLNGYRLENPAELWRELDPQLSKNRFAQCALDCAIWDIFAKMHKQPLWQVWGLRADDQRPPTCYTIGLDTPATMVRKMQAMPNWPVYKIKLDSTGGLDLVRELRKHTSAVFRVDANCSWKASQVLAWAEALAELNVELIEQPLIAEAYDEMKQLKGRSPIPLMADESCQVEADVNRCIDSFDAINIKLVKCGGLTPARRMIARAHQNGLQVMVGCMTESSIGIAPGVHLLPLLDFADLDGALLLSQDIASGITWHTGHCELPIAHGLGVTLL
jgi:L-Ala-D/L-Glu epimerase